MYKNTKSIAILLAVYNGEKYLPTQIDSLISQTNHDWTLYIRDDGSNDGTNQIISNYCEKYDNIVQIDKGGHNLGCYKNFFRLLEVVDSEYYMFCDADDYWLPEKIEISYNFIKDKENQYPYVPILVHTDKAIADGNLNILFPSHWKYSRFNPDSISKFEHVPLRIVGGATAMFNAACKQHGLEPTSFHDAHDGWLAFQTARFGKIFAIHQPLLIYRRHGENVTDKDSSGTMFKNQFRRLLNLKSFLSYHFKLASDLKSYGYGSASKYFYYRIVVFVKIVTGKIMTK
ncbi:glycosyltransferase [Pedobacter psychrodurus]|uniref:glycosyltransferase n=1 Tax=Pedobacter psychrodurus TaxID=2530456 RepID=UPI00292E629A|nr:glycosyltransferase [Pedobacter psychrodurus]